MNNGEVTVTRLFKKPYTKKSENFDYKFFVLYYGYRRCPFRGNSEIYIIIYLR